MKLKKLPETALLTIFLHYKVRKNKKEDERTLFWDCPWFLTCRLTLRIQMPHICGCLDCFSFSHFLATSCCPLQLKTKFIKLRTKIHIKEVKYLSSRCIQQKWLSFFKNLKKLLALRVNETKAASRNAFIDNLFALQNEKK